MSALLTRPLSESPPQVYVEFDDLEWEKREWVKVYEDFQIFLLEHQLVWAKRKECAQVQGAKAKQIQWPALVSDPVALFFCRSRAAFPSSRRRALRGSESANAHFKTTFRGGIVWNWDIFIWFPAVPHLRSWPTGLGRECNFLVVTS